MELLSNTNDILISLLGLAPPILAAGIVLLALRRKEQVTSVLCCISNRTYALAVATTVMVMTVSCFFMNFKVNPFGDVDRYFVRALNIVENGVFGYGATPTAVYPPGYSFILVPAAAFFGNTRWAYYCTNITLLAGVSIWVRFLLRRLGVPERPANLVSLLVLLYPNRLLSTLIPASDIPFSLAYLCAFLVMTLSMSYPGRWRYPLVTGLIAGIASLIRANGLPLMIPLGVGLWGSQTAPRRVRVRNVGLMLFSMLTILMPWTIRNALLFGSFVPVSNNFGINLAIGNNPSDRITYNTYVDSVWADPDAWRAAGGESWNEGERDRFFANQGFQYIREHPFQFVVLGCRKVFHTMASDASTFGTLETCTNLRTLVFSVFPHTRPSRTSGIAYSMYSVGYRMLFVLNNVAYYTSIIVVVLVLLRHRRRLTGPEVAYVIVAVITCGLVFLLFGISRYKEPMPLLTILLICFAIFPPRKPSSAPGSAIADNSRYTTPTHR